MSASPRQILDGTLADGEPLPSAKELAAAHGVSVSTAHRALDLLKTWRLIATSRGRRSTITRP